MSSVQVMFITLVRLDSKYLMHDIIVHTVIYILFNANTWQLYLQGINNDNNNKLHVADNFLNRINYVIQKSLHHI